MDPTMDQLELYLSGAKRGKASGESGVTKEALKSLTKKGMETVLNVLIAFWRPNKQAYQMENMDHTMLSL